MSASTSIVGNKPSLLRTTFVLTGALLAASLITRFIALLLPNFYGLHAVLCAPLMTAIIFIETKRSGQWIAVVIALGAMALMLGAMRPVQMGLPFLVAAICALVAANIFENRPRVAPAAVSGSCSVSLYPATVAGGLLSRSLSVSGWSVLMVVLTATIVAVACLLVITLLSDTH